MPGSSNDSNVCVCVCGCVWGGVGGWCFMQTYVIDILDDGELVVPQPVQLPDNLVVGGETVQCSGGLHVHGREITLRRL